jgi:hypothetical protein
VPMNFFDLALGPTRLHDYDGVELTNEENARDHALGEALHCLKTGQGSTIGSDQCAIEVVNVNGRILFLVPSQPREPADPFKQKSKTRPQ